MTASDHRAAASANSEPQGSSSPVEALILILDSSLRRARKVQTWLRQVNYRTMISTDTTEALMLARAHRPDLILLEADLKTASWGGVCRELRRSEQTNLPILLLTDAENTDWDAVVKGLEIGATNSVNDFLVKPFGKELLLAKVRTTLRVGTLQHELRISNSMMKELTQYLDNMVEAKVAELENVNRLRRFFSPQIVEAIVSEDADEILKEHRGVITVVFLDLRKFTPFAEAHAPQEVIRLVRDFHETVGPVIFRYGGTLERFTGDGMMVFLGDPKPMPEHAYEAICMGLHAQHVIKARKREWSKAGYDFSIGIGIATGEATMGTIGFERRYDYAAIGTVTNLASRLCNQAAAGEILISQETYHRVRDRVYTRSCGQMRFKGFSKPAPVHAVEGLHVPFELE